MSEVTLIRCVGCGVPLGQMPYTDAHVEHARNCPKHPLASEVARLTRERDEAREVLREVGIRQLAGGWVKCAWCARMAVLSDEARAQGFFPHVSGCRLARVLAGEEP